MRALQFWILLLCSTVISLLLIKQVMVNRALIEKERDLAESQQVAATGPGYQNAWKQLAVRVYQVGRTDPGLLGVLKGESIVIHTAAPVGSTTNSDTNPVPPASSKAPAPTTHPVTP